MCLCTSPMEDQWKFQWGGGWQKQKFFKICMEQNWNLWRVGGVQTKKTFPEGWGIGCFLEPHNGICNLLPFTQVVDTPLIKLAVSCMVHFYVLPCLPPGTSPRVFFFLLGGLFPTPQAHRKRQFPTPRAPHVPQICHFV